LVLRGGYAATHRREDVVTVLDGVKKIAAERGIEVRYAEGCGVRSLSKDGFPAALEAARQSDVIVAMAGGSSRIRPMGSVHFGGLDRYAEIAA
jgi:beta-glucosidase